MKGGDTMDKNSKDVSYLKWYRNFLWDKLHGKLFPNEFESIQSRFRQIDNLLSFYQ